MGNLEKTGQYRLRTSDFDRYNRIKPAVVLDIFQDIAALQADDMGVGFDRMVSRNVLWIIARTKIEIVRNPATHSVVSARTWPHSPTRLTFQRDYSLRDEAGELLAKASSEWMMMNAQTRALESIYDHYDPSGDEYSSDRAFEKKVRRSKPFPLEEATAGPFEVMPPESDVDTNGHINNTCYITYVLDALELGADESVRTLQIDYRHEVYAGQRLKIMVKRDGHFILAQGLKADGEVAFSCEIELFE